MFQNNMQVFWKIIAEASINKLSVGGIKFTLVLNTTAVF